MWYKLSKKFNQGTKIDLILTNRRLNLSQHSNAFETGVSYIHLLTVTEFKMWFQKLKSKIIAYRYYKNFHYTKFRSDIVIATSNVDNFDMFKRTFCNIFNRHVPIKRSTFVLMKLPSYQRASESHHKEIKSKEIYSSKIELILATKIQHPKKYLYNFWKTLRNLTLKILKPKKYG